MITDNTPKAGLMSPMEAVLSDPSQVWLTSYFGFTPEDWGFLSFTDKGRRDTVIEQTKAGFLVIIYGSSNAKTPPSQRGKVIGIYQCSHEIGVAEDFTSALGMARKRRLQSNPNQWNHGIRAVRAWAVTPETYQSIADFAPVSYKSGSGTTISRHGIQLHPSDAQNLLNLDLVEVDVFGSELLGSSLIGSARSIFENPTPSKAGPVSQSPFKTRESEGPKHLYVLELTGPTEELFDIDVSGQKVIKVGFSKSPQMRCDQFNKAIPICKLGWHVHLSTFDEGLAPFPSSEHAKAGEDVMKVYLDKNAKSLGGEFFLANPEQIFAVWEKCKLAAKEVS